MIRAAILAWLIRLVVYSEDIHDPRKAPQLEDVATAIAEASQGDRKVAALLSAHGFEETGWSIRIHDGRCHSWECDHGRARGPWQLWRNPSMTDGDWERMRGLENTQAQAAAAADRIRLGLRQCNGNPRGSIARYLGLPCDDRSRAVMHRLNTYRWAYAKLAPEPAPVAVQDPAALGSQQ